jgi:hypothetical protein
MAFIWARQLPLPPVERLIRSPGGSAFSSTASPDTPSIQSRFISLKAAANDKASRRSVREGRLRTNIFSNYEFISLTLNTWKFYIRIVTLQPAHNWTIFPESKKTIGLHTPNVPFRISACNLSLPNDLIYPVYKFLSWVIKNRSAKINTLMTLG